MEVKLVLIFESKEYELNQRLYPVKKMCEKKYLGSIINLDLELNEPNPNQNDVVSIIDTT